MQHDALQPVVTAEFLADIRPVLYGTPRCHAAVLCPMSGCRQVVQSSKGVLMEKYFSNHPLAIVCAVAAALIFTSFSDSTALALLAPVVGFILGSLWDSKRK